MQVTLSVPNDIKARIDERVRDRFYADISEYLLDLVRNDPDSENWPSETLRAAIAEGEASGFSNRTPEEILREARLKYVAGRDFGSRPTAT